VLVKFLITKFHKNPFFGTEVIAKDGRTDMTKLIGTFLPTLFRTHRRLTLSREGGT